MNKTSKGIIAIIAIAAVFGAIYIFTHKNKVAYAKAIIKMNGSTGTLAKLIVFDEGYLKAWAKALARKQESFGYNGENYSTSGGKKIIS